MKTKDEIKQQASEHFRQAHPQLIYTNTQVNWMLQQYSDQNTKPLAQCLKELIEIYMINVDENGEPKDNIIKIADTWIKAGNLLSQYDKENDCV